MAALVKADISTGTGILQSPLFLLSSAVHIFRMIDFLRQTSSSSASQRAVSSQQQDQLHVYSHHHHRQPQKNHLQLRDPSPDARQQSLLPTSSVVQARASGRSSNAWRTLKVPAGVHATATERAQGGAGSLPCKRAKHVAQLADSGRQGAGLRTSPFVRDVSDPPAGPAGLLRPLPPRAVSLPLQPPLVALHEQLMCGCVLGLGVDEASVAEEVAAAAATATRRTATAGQAVQDTESASPQWLQAATVFAGAVSRTAAQVAIHPLDTLKTRMQVRLPTPQLRIWRAVVSCPTTRLRALAAWAGAAGARDVMLGVGAAVAGVLPSSALYFASEPCFRKWLGHALSEDGESPICRLTSSAAAATLSALIRVPADVVKHRVQAYAFPNARHAARAILATRGPAGLYAGFGATLLRDAPEIVIQFTMYRQLKALMKEWPGGGGDAGGGGGAAEHLFLGGAAGAVAALTTTPLDVIKTQLQCGAAASVPTAAVQVLRAGGAVALFSGLTPRLLQTTLSSALFFLCFESSKCLLDDLAADSAAGNSASQARRPLAATAVAAARVEAAALRESVQDCEQPPPPLPRRRQHPGWWRRLRLDRGDEPSDAAATAAGEELWAAGGGGGNGTLTPVALYAYAFAGATAPVAAAVAAAASATGGLQVEAP